MRNVVSFGLIWRPLKIYPGCLLYLFLGGGMVGCVVNAGAGGNRVSAVPTVGVGVGVGVGVRGEGSVTCSGCLATYSVPSFRSRTDG